MPVNSVIASNSFQQMVAKHPAYPQVVTQQQNTQFQGNTSDSLSKKRKTAYVTAGVALAALAGVYLVKTKPGTLKNLFSGSDSKKQLIFKKITEIKNRSENEFNRILNENNIFGEIKLDNIDKAAELRAVDKNRQDYLHEAANMAEEAYKIAYQKAKPESGKNILDKIFFRIDKESKTLTDIYKKMPRDEAVARIEYFAKSAFMLDRKKGMTVNEFSKKLTKLIYNK